MTYSFLAVMVIALVTLAYLQYHWLGSVSVGERARLEESLQASSENFATDYDKVFKNAANSFRVQAFNESDRLEEVLERSYAHWKLKTGYPELIDSLFVISGVNNENFKAEYFHVEQKKMKEVHGVDRIKKWVAKSSFKDKSNSLKFNDTPTLGKSSFITVPIRKFSVIPDATNITVTGDLDNITSRVSLTLEDTSDLILLKLSNGVIKDEIIPALAKTYFSESYDDQYYLQIRSTDESDAPYYVSSDEIDINQTPDVRAKLNKVDLTNFIIFDSGVFTGTLPESAGNINAVHSVSREIQGLSINKTDTTNILAITQSFSTNERIKNAVTFGDSSYSYSYSTNSGQNRSRQRTSFNDTLITARFNNALGGNTNWELWLTSKAGSLDNFVAQTRLTNLGISFFILAILGISGFLIVLYSQRSQVLADQQMLFVAGVSHELRTPLSVIRSAAENMSDGVVGTREKQKEYADLMLKEGRRLSDMVDHIMEYSGIQSGRKVYHFSRVDTKDFFEQAISDMMPIVHDHGFTVDYNLDTRLDTVDLDQDAIKLCVSNLINNGMKFSEQPHTIMVDVSPGTINKKPAICCSITDQGIGISEEEQKRIFDPFFRGQKPLKEQVKGNGIGLSLVKKVVEAHKGVIEVQSEVGKGTTFRVFIPKDNEAIG